MNTINHVLWGATIGRSIGMPIEGAIVGGLPDLFSIPILGYFKIINKDKLNKIPKLAFNIYSFLHNWWLGLILTGILYLIDPKLFVLGLCYDWHIFQDAFVHTDMATKFLYPIWKGKVQKYSVYDHKWVQFVDLIIIIFVNLIIDKKF